MKSIKTKPKAKPSPEAPKEAGLTNPDSYRDSNLFPVVGIGASAGGLFAFAGVFNNEQKLK